MAKILCPKLYDKYIFTPYINSMLSNPVTHTANIAGNAVMAGMMPLTKFMSGGAAIIRGDVNEAAKYTRQAYQMVVGQTEGIMDFFRLKRPAITKEARRAAFVRQQKVLRRYPMEDLSAIAKFGGEDVQTSGVPRSLPAAFERDLKEGLVRVFGRYVIQGPTTALNNMDTLFKMIAYRGELYSRAYGEAFDAGGSAAARTINMHKFINNPSKQYMVEPAVQKAMWATYTNELEGFPKTVSKLSQVPILNLYVPFMRTPMNVLLNSLEYTLAAPIQRRFREAWMQGGEARYMAEAKVATGLGMGLMLTYLLGDNITGGNAKPGTPEFELQKATGRPPKSINIFGNWISLDKVEILDTVLKPISIFHDIARYHDPDDASMSSMLSDYTANLALSYVSMFQEEGVFNSVSDLINGFITVVRAGNNWRQDTKSMNLTDQRLANQRFWSQVGGVISKPGQSVLPRVVDYFNVNLKEEWGGNKYRRVKNQANALAEYGDSLRARIPGLSNRLAPERNAFGDPISVPYGLTMRGMNPAYVYEGSNLVNPENARLAEEIVRLRVELPRHSSTISGMVVTPEEKSGVQLETGKIFSTMMKATVGSRFYQGMTDSQKNAHIKHLYSKARKAGIHAYGGKHTDFAAKLGLQKQINRLEGRGIDASALLEQQDMFR